MAKCVLMGDPSTCGGAWGIDFGGIRGPCGRVAGTTVKAAGTDGATLLGTVSAEIEGK